MNLEIPEYFSYLEINEDYEEAIDQIYLKNKNVIILGKAGTGKSQFIHLMKSLDEQNNIQSIFVAPTGIAAVNIQGQTIHSLFKLGIDIVDPEDVYLHDEVEEIIKNCDRIIIDEISMLRADLFDIIDNLCKKALDNNNPFGGLQVVCIGDMFQIPPIISDNKVESDLYTNMYGENPFFFASKVYEVDKNAFTKILFEKIYRQNDFSYKKILNKIREGKQNNSDLITINSKRMTYRKFKREFPDGVYIAPFNKIVNEVNMEELKKLPGEKLHFSAFISGKINPKSFIVPIDIYVKPGAKIMMLTNDKSKRFQNGTMAYFEEVVSHDRIKINIDGCSHTIERYKFVDYEYKVRKGKIVKEEKGSFQQYPIKLAFAITAHKSQGCTFTEGYIDFSWKIFSEHMVYVMLSRFSDFERIGLKRNLKHEDIMISDYVKEFMNE